MVTNSKTPKCIGTRHLCALFICAREIRLSLSRWTLPGDEFCSLCSLLQEWRRFLKQNYDTLSEERAGPVGDLWQSAGQSLWPWRAGTLQVHPTQIGAEDSSYTTFPPGKMEIKRFEDNLWLSWNFFICWPCLPGCGVSTSLPTPGSAPIRESHWISLGKL